jgi:hypothetical protein
MLKIVGLMLLAGVLVSIWSGQFSVPVNAQVRAAHSLVVSSSPAGGSNSVVWIVDQDRGTVQMCSGAPAGPPPTCSAPIRLP